MAKVLLQVGVGVDRHNHRGGHRCQHRVERMVLARLGLEHAP